MNNDVNWNLTVFFVVMVGCGNDNSSSNDSSVEACANNANASDFDISSNSSSELSVNSTLILAPPEFERVWLFLLLLSLCVVTVCGNLLVVAAVLRERSLHSATNYFITSLAVADCLVGLVVMPFSAVLEGMGGRWVFGADACDAWHSLDVLGTTASILNLCVISLDRYWAITNPMTYPSRMSDARASLLILLVWLCSSAISFPAIAWWRAVASGPSPPYECLFTEDTGYLVFSSTVSFYGPLTVMVFTYARVYRAAAAHMRNIRRGAKTLQGADGELRIHRGGGGTIRHPHHSPSASNGVSINNNTGGKNLLVSSGGSRPKFPLSRKMKSFAKERKAAKTLGTVMGVFIICWLPFFVTNIVSGVCPECIPDPVVFSVVTWLGWCNSGMNPVIYACCSKDFRR